MARPFYKNTKAGLVSKLSRRYNRIIFLTASWNFIVFKDIAVSRFNSMNGVLMYISHREHYLIDRIEHFKDLGIPGVEMRPVCETFRLPHVRFEGKNKSLTPKNCLSCIIKPFED